MMRSPNSRRWSRSSRALRIRRSKTASGPSDRKVCFRSLNIIAFHPRSPTVVGSEHASCSPVRGRICMMRAPNSRRWSRWSRALRISRSKTASGPSDRKVCSRSSNIIAFHQRSLTVAAPIRAARVSKRYADMVHSVSTGDDFAELGHEHLVRILVVLFEIVHGFPEVHLLHDGDDLRGPLFPPLLALGRGGGEGRRTAAVRHHVGDPRPEGQAAAEAKLAESGEPGILRPGTAGLGFGVAIIALDWQVDDSSRDVVRAVHGLAPCVGRELELGE